MSTKFSLIYFTLAAQRPMDLNASSFYIVTALFRQALYFINFKENQRDLGSLQKCKSVFSV